MKFFEYLEIISAFAVFGIIVFLHLDFYHIVVLILELIVIIEVMQMLFVFFKKQRIKLRLMIDVSIIFFIREVLISTTSHKNSSVITEYVLLIGIFFFFRYLALKITYSKE